MAFDINQLTDDTARRIKLIESMIINTGIYFIRVRNVE